MEHPQPLVRISFTATLDECVDTYLQYLQRSGEARRWRRIAMRVNGTAMGAIFLIVGSPLWMRGDGVFPLFLSAALVAVGVGFLSGPVHDGSLKRRTRRQFAEQMDASQTVPVDIELRPGGVWVRQDEIETFFPWTEVTAVEDAPTSVNIWLRRGVVVARDRAFDEVADRDSYLAHARRLAEL
jgi:hypothetical protein